MIRHIITDLDNNAESTPATKKLIIMRWIIVDERKCSGINRVNKKIWLPGQSMVTIMAS